MRMIHAPCDGIVEFIRSIVVEADTSGTETEGFPEGEEREA